MVCLNRISFIRKAVVVVATLCAVGFGSLSSAQAQCVGSPAQCRNCLLAGQPILFFPGDPGPEARSLQGVVYTETGPFLSAPGAATNVSAQMSMNPPAPAGSQLLAAAMLETMGYCEGPITFSQVGDGGTATTNFGPCGSITDTFTVVSDGTGSTPYQIQHNLSGSLTLQNLPALGPEIDRTGSITIGPASANGEVRLFSGSTALCAGTFTGTYSTHSTVPLPWPCVIRTPWTSFTASNNTASGTVARQPLAYGLTSITPSSGPTGGGTAVSLCGPGICTTLGVTLGGGAANNLACGSSATCPGPDFPLLATTPAHVAGKVDVVATNGAATATLTQGYAYLAAAVPALPTIWAVLALAGILGLTGWWRANGNNTRNRR
jgi:hypothetical protein